MRKILICIAVSSLLALGATPVYAADPPPLPHAFYGTVEINGSQARVGTRVEARGDGVEPGTYNPITTTERGKFGSADPLGAKLIVQGDISGGTTIKFYIDGVFTGETYPFDSGETTSLELSVTITEAPSPPPPTVDTNLFGIEGSFRISSTGEILETIVATSEDENVTITIEAGTIALLDGEPLETLTAAVDPSPPEPPEGTYLIEAYDFGPDGATFDPPITLIWIYDPGALPEGVSEEDLVIGYYDEAIDDWAWVPCGINTATNTITALVSHFTTFAIIAVPVELPLVVLPPVGEEEEEEEEEEVITVTPAAFSVSYLSVSPRLEVEPGETVTITVSVANTGGESGSYTVVLKIDGVKEAEKTVTVAAGESQDARFSVTREEAGIYTITVDGLSGSFTVVAPLEEVPTKPGVNWPLIGGIIGGVIVVGLGVFFWMRRRVAY